MDLLFSIIIPTFNREDTIPEAIQSALSQPGNDYEVIVVDDGSLDRTVALIEERFGSDVTVVQQENQGVGAARNKGLNNAKGCYVVFLDSDDMLLPWTLECYREIIRTHKSPNTIFNLPVRFSLKNDLEELNSKSLQAECHEDFNAATGKFTTEGAFVVAKRESVQRAGSYSEERINFEDWDLHMKMGGEAGFVVIHSPATYAYRHTPGSLVSNARLNYLGVSHMIQQEKQGLYPGGDNRKQGRRTFISAHVRPVSLQCLRESEVASAFRLYSQTLLWHLREFRFKYLFGFFAYAAKYAVGNFNDS